MVVVNEVSALVCVSLEEADEHGCHSVPVVGCHCLAEGVRCAIEKSVLGAVGAALGIGDKREHFREVGIDGEFLPLFTVAEFAQEGTHVAVLVGEAVDLGDECERGAGGHCVLEVADGAPRVLLKLVGGLVVCGRALSDFVFFVTREPGGEQGNVDVPVRGDDVLVAASVAVYDGEVGGGAGARISGGRVGFCRSVGELVVINGVWVGRYGVSLLWLSCLGFLTLWFLVYHA